MTENQNENQVQNQETISDKERNFRALEQKHKREIESERIARMELEKKLEEIQSKITQTDNEDEDDEPYVGHKKLNKTLNRFGQQTQSEIQKSMEMAKQAAKDEIKREMWLENNPDFYDVLQHAEKFAQSSPKLAESILRMPEGFERQKLVYENIKAMNLHKPQEKAPSIQDKIDVNRKSPYYQPTGIANSPYATAGDFSEKGQENAYKKMQELKKNLRI